MTYQVRPLSALLFAFQLISLLVTTQSPAQTPIPYYGEKFYKNQDLKGDELIQHLNRILSGTHQQVTGKPDEIVSDCSKGTRCYTHQSVGYNRAKSKLLSDYYLVQSGNSYVIKDVYCEKEYVVPGPNAIPDSTELNIEHTWPQSKFTGHYSQEMQKADMHHLFPSDSQLNSIRGNYPFGEVSKDEKKLDCPASRYGIAKNGNRIVFEPPVQHRGNVARALFYFSVRYQINIDDKQEEYLREWHRQDPADDSEKERNNEIFKLQNNRNPFIDMPDLVERIQNF